MQRSGSQMRVSDTNKPGDTEHLPTHNPLSDIAEKETFQLKAAENAVHFIPIVLILCVIILWFLSTSGFLYTTFTYGTKVDAASSL